MFVKIPDDWTGGIVGLFETVAYNMNEKLSESDTFDCKKILVSQNIQDKIFDFYRSKGNSDFSISMAWVNYGPKVFEGLVSDYCAVEDGFIVRGEKINV